jgi:hypothetical protein
VIYLVVVLVDVMQPSGPITVDYLQNSAPAAQISVVPDDDEDVFAVVADGMDTVRVEQSDLYAHSYVAYSTGLPPAVIDLTEVRRQFRTPVPAPETPGGREAAVIAAPEGIGGPLHLMSRPPFTILTAESEAIILIAR